MTCDRFESRLIGGERPSDDPALGAHVGSCLRCFRTAADMREVPRLAALLREGEPLGDEAGAADPGARFWEKFPGTVGAAWAASRSGAGVVPLRAGAPVPSWWARVAAWLRRPVPAAFTGAACAVGLAFLVMRPGETAPPGPVQGAAGAELRDMASGFVIEGALDDSMAELDLEGLVTLRDGLVRVMGPQTSDADGHGAPAGGEAGPAGAEAEEAAAAAAPSDPSKVADDLELLDETGLLALQQNLRDRI